ncbi:MAG: hypothetical protein QW589_04130, partial [Candidatus Bathyarchaeia archaeon]
MEEYKLTGISIEKLTQKLDSLRKELESLKNLKELHIKEAKKWFGERNKLNEEFKKAKIKAKELKGKRDELYLKIKDLKTKRDEIKGITLDKKKEVDKLKEKIDELSKYLPKNPCIIKESLKNLEWKIQTTPLSLEEEKKLIEDIKRLEQKSIFLDEFNKLKAKHTELIAEIKALNIKAKLIHEELSRLIEEMRPYHQKMIEAFEEAKRIKIESDKCHKMYILEKEKAYE